MASNITRTRDAIVRYIRQRAEFFRDDEASRRKCAEYNQAMYSQGRAEALERIAQEIEDKLYQEI